MHNRPFLGETWEYDSILIALGFILGLVVGVVAVVFG